MLPNSSSTPIRFVFNIFTTSTFAAEARQAAQTHEHTLGGLVGQLLNTYLQLTTPLCQSAPAPVTAGDDSAPVHDPALGLVLWATTD